MHQPMRQLAIGRKQQTRRIDIQTADHDPTTLAWFWQTIENGGATLRIRSGTPHLPVCDTQSRDDTE